MHSDMVCMNVHVEMVDQETQALQWVDRIFMARFQEQIWKMENECFTKAQMNLKHTWSPV